VLEKSTQIHKLKKELPKVKEYVADKLFSPPELNVIEYLIASAVSLAETVPSLNNSSQIRRIEKLQSSNRYPTNLGTIISIVEGLLDTLDVVVKD